MEEARANFSWEDELDRDTASLAASVLECFTQIEQWDKPEHKKSGPKTRRIWRTPGKGGVATLTVAGDASFPLRHAESVVLLLHQVTSQLVGSRRLGDKWEPLRTALNGLNITSHSTLASLERAHEDAHSKMNKWLRERRPGESWSVREELKDGLECFREIARRSQGLSHVLIRLPRG